MFSEFNKLKIIYRRLQYKIFYSIDVNKKFASYFTKNSIQNILITFDKI